MQVVERVDERSAAAANLGLSLDHDAWHKAVTGAPMRHQRISKVLPRSGLSKRPLLTKVVTLSPYTG